jgi:hypothetical protein
VIESVRFEGRVLIVDSGSRIELEFPIVDAFARDDLVVVLFAHDADPRGYGNFSNLIAVTSTGRQAWIAELPTNQGDAYVQISSREPLLAYSWSGFDCTLEPRNGKIVRKVFLK